MELAQTATATYDLSNAAYVTLAFTLFWCVALLVAGCAVVELRRRIATWKSAVSEALGEQTPVSFARHPRDLTPSTASAHGDAAVQATRAEPDPDVDLCAITGAQEPVVRVSYGRDADVLDFRPMNVAFCDLDAVKELLASLQATRKSQLVLHQQQRLIKRDRDAKHESAPLKALRMRYRGMDAASVSLVAAVAVCILVIYATFFTGAGVGVAHYSCSRAYYDAATAAGMPVNAAARDRYTREQRHVFWLKNVIFFIVLCISFFCVHYTLMGTSRISTGAFFLACLVGASFLLAVSASAVASGSAYAFVMLASVLLWLAFIWLHKWRIAPTRHWAWTSPASGPLQEALFYVNLYYALLLCAVVVYNFVCLLSGDGLNLLGDAGSIAVKCVIEAGTLAALFYALYCIHARIADALGHVVLDALRTAYLPSAQACKPSSASLSLPPSTSRPRTSAPPANAAPLPSATVVAASATSTPANTLIVPLSSGRQPADVVHVKSVRPAQEMSPGAPVSPVVVVAAATTTTTPPPTSQPTVSSVPSRVPTFSYRPIVVPGVPRSSTQPPGPSSGTNRTN